MSAAHRRYRWARLGWRLHRQLYGRLGGRLGVRVGRHRVLLLTTTGRRSGKPRVVALSYVDHAGGPAVIGSFAGDARDPAWVRNLRGDPDGRVQVGKNKWPVRARELFGEERAAGVRRFEEMDGRYRVYQARTGRAFPVFVLERS